MRLALGDDGEHGPLIDHITPAYWDALAAQEKQSRWLQFRGDGGVVWVRLDVRDGRTVLTGLLVGTEQPLDVATLRNEIPLGRLRELAAAHADDAMRAAIPFGQLEGVALPQETRKRPGRRGHPPEMLARVAETWSTALRARPRAPMTETARQLGYSVAQARRLVRRAQAEGFIDSESED